MSQHKSLKHETQSPNQAKGSTAVLTVDLSAIGQNYAQLNAMAPTADCAAVIKADAYGTGAMQVGPYLYGQGCRNFFVATLSEGLALRTVLSDVKIYILDGLFEESSLTFRKYNLIPVLGSMKQVEEWSAFCLSSGQKLSAVLHIDTGMNRLGLGPDEMASFFSHQDKLLTPMKLELIISHLACADDPKHPLNQKQLKRFQEILKKCPDVPVSFANSSGIFLGSDFQFDLLRPGVALFGGCPVNGSANPMRSVVSLISYIVQIRTVPKGEPIGYGASYVTTRDTRVATLPVGYADGYLRALGSTNDRKGASAYIGEYEAPLLGRVSMDLITIDITDIPMDEAQIGTDVELMGPHISVDDLAEIAGTIGYEILTSLGVRYDRHYKGEV